jgi:hypothetical protein
MDEMREALQKEEKFLVGGVRARAGGSQSLQVFLNKMHGPGLVE